jgi:hypothetical protein
VEREAELQGCFKAFFPELQEFAREWVEVRGGWRFAPSPARQGWGGALLIFAGKAKIKSEPLLTAPYFAGGGASKNAARRRRLLRLY